MRGSSARAFQSRPKVLFPHRTANTMSSNASNPNNIMPPGKLTEIIPAEEQHNPASSSPTGSPPSVPATIVVPALFTSPPPIRDQLETDTTRKQDEVLKECLPCLAGRPVRANADANAPASSIGHQSRGGHGGVPLLRRLRHIRFLRHNLGSLPAGFVSADASRPWLLYWSLSSLHLLGEDVGGYRDRLVDTARSMQNPDGGFGGGFGQTSHLATTYAILLALALVGGETAYELVNRRTLWRWLGGLKCADGGFRMSVDGEEDVRGAYCAAVVVSLLNLPRELALESPALQANPDADLFTGLGDYVRKCQTFEGGISGQPGAEAHGAYAFCALGCLAILDTPRRYLNVTLLISWLSARQYAPEGGLSGRTNKLVDGCYAHWIGGCWPLIEACLDDGDEPDAEDARRQGLVPIDESLYNREGLIRYILCCCQDTTPRGGMRDKPSKPSDPYHTCYTLTGLSSAQHQWKTSQPVDEHLYPEHTRWISSPCEEPGVLVFDEKDRLPTVHPAYAIPVASVDDIRAYFAAKQGF